MNRLVALNSAAHRNLRVNPAKVHANAAQLNMVPVVLGEFLKLCVQYPIALTKNGTTGQFTCVALFGFEKAENLFWTQDRWDALYVPLQVGRQPFFLGSDQLVLIDALHPSVQEVHGQAIFDESGSETPYLQQVKQMLAALLDGEKQTDRFIRKLLALELVRPMRLEIEFANRQQQRIEGLYCVDDARLKELAAEAVAVFFYV